MADNNPFAQPRENRSKTLTFRMTETEYAAIKAVADRESVEIVDLVREGLSLVIEKRQRAKPRRS